MWFFKFLFLLGLIASWIPIDSQANDQGPPATSKDFESEEEQEEELEEEEVVV